MNLWISFPRMGGKYSRQPWVLRIFTSHEILHRNLTARYPGQRTEQGLRLRFPFPGRIWSNIDILYLVSLLVAIKSVLTTSWGSYSRGLKAIWQIIIKLQMFIISCKISNDITIVLGMYFSFSDLHNIIYIFIITFEKY